MSRDIIWISLESIRQDHCTLTGSADRDTTPQLRRFASRSSAATFSNCFTHDIWTRSSTASILTGRAASDHRTWDNDAKLRDSVTTIPEQLSDLDYRTVGISPIGQFSHATGLDRGFDRFHYLTRNTLTDEVGYVDLAKYLLQVHRHSAGFTTDTKRHCIGYLSNSIAKRHIRRAASSDDPLFLYIHHGDSHHVYYPPKAWRSRFADGLPISLSDALEVALSMSNDLHKHIANGASESFSADEWEALLLLYDTLISYVDHLSADLATYAQEHLDDPIIVVTADHGELFGEDEMLAHMLSTHTAVSNVPMIIAGLDTEPGHSDDLIQHADVFQMISNELELDLEVPIGQDIRSDRRTHAIVQRSGKRAQTKLDEICGHNPDFDRDRFSENDLTSIRTHDFRYERSSSGSSLFALPDENADVADEFPDVVDRLDTELDTWIDEFGTPETTDEQRAEFTDDMKQQLSDLGYLD